MGSIGSSAELGRFPRQSAMLGNGRACVMVFRSRQELRDEAVEVVRTLDRHDVRRAVALDHFELGARNLVGDLAALVHWREQILLADDAEGACLHACQAVQHIVPQDRLGLSVICLRADRVWIARQHRDGLLNRLLVAQERGENSQVNCSQAKISPLLLFALTQFHVMIGWKAARAGAPGAPVRIIRSRRPG